MWNTCDISCPHTSFLSGTFNMIRSGDIELDWLESKHFLFIVNYTEIMHTWTDRHTSLFHSLADLVTFHRHISDRYSLSDKNTWISFGGSYAGALSAWLRGKVLFLCGTSTSTSVGWDSYWSTLCACARWRIETLTHWTSLPSYLLP